MGSLPKKMVQGRQHADREKVVAQIMALPYPKIVIPAPEQFRP